MINVTALILKLSFFYILDGDVPRSTSYGVYIFQLIRFARASSHVSDFNTGNKLFTQKLLYEGYWYHKLRKTFSKFYGHTMIRHQNSKFELNLSCANDFRYLQSMMTLCMNRSNIFSAQYIKIISHYKKIGHNVNVLQQTPCLVVNPITFGSFAFLFNCTPVGRNSDSMTVPT